MSDPIRYLSVEDVLRIRDQLAQHYGDSFDVLRFQQLLSALATPQQSLFGEEIFPTLCAKAGMLLTALVRNHPFWDGNKRIATAALRLFIERNGARCTADQQKLKAFTTTIAKGELRDGDLVKWVDNHMEDL